MAILTKFAALGAAATALLAHPAAAQVMSWDRVGGGFIRGPGGGGGGEHGGPYIPHQVPEIDASAGLLALAAIGVVMLFVWERRRREAHS